MKAGGLPRTVVAAVAAGTLLNPLNSSMIAVALVDLSDSFRVSTTTATWLISAFYMAGAIGMPVMGRLADLFGPRRLFCLGLAAVAATGSLAPLSPSFGWLLVARVVQAFATAVAYPAGLAIFRARSGSDRAPAAALGSLSIAGSVSAALGPVLGGGLVALAGWRGIFLANVPLSLIGLALALCWLQEDAPRPARAGRSRSAALLAALRGVDPAGIALFGALVVSVLGLLISLTEGPQVWLLPIAAAAFVALVAWERGRAAPFLDVRLLGSNRRLSATFAQFAGVTLIYYAILFGLPLWLQQARGFTPDATGMLMLPIAGVGIVATPVAARLIARFGPRRPLITGSALLIAGSLSLLALGAATPVAAIVAISIVLGVPNGFNNLALQAAVYEAAPPDKTGAIGGIFQTFRYVGAILSTAVLGLVLGPRATSGGVHGLGAVNAAVSLLLLTASLLTPGRRPRR